MKSARFLILYAIFVNAFLFGCENVKGTNSTGMASVQSDCSIPTLFTADAHSQSITVSQLTKMTGNFQLSSVALYSLSKQSRGGALSAFSAGATIATDANGVRDSKVQSICAQASDTPYAQDLSLIMSLHLPSTRITQYDLNDSKDQPQTNNPTYARFISDTSGNVKFKMAFSDKGPPYSSALTLTDWIAQLPSQPSISLLADGSIEMRIHWNEKNSETRGYLLFQQQKI